MKNSLKLILIIVACFVSLFLFNNNWFEESETPIESTIDYNAEFGWKSMYYYNQLDDDAKVAYEIMYASVKSFEEKCTLKIDGDTLSDVFTAVLYDNPEIFWIKTDYKYFNYGEKVVFKPNYSYTQDETMQYTVELNNKINEILTQASFCVTDYEKELLFHDYICENTVYDMNTFGNVGASVHNTLINGRAVCEGYARAMQILLDKSGIYNYLVIGDGTADGETEPHMWNVVKLNNENYHLDVTWNDNDETNIPSYIYFNVTDEQISRDHSNFTPTDNNCYGTYFNYAVRNGTYAYTFYHFSQFADASAKVLRTGRNTVELCFKNKVDYDRALSSIDDNEQIFEYVNSTVKKSGRNLKTDAIEYYSDDDLQYICIIFKEG